MRYLATIVIFYILSSTAFAQTADKDAIDRRKDSLSTKVTNDSTSQIARPSIIYWVTLGLGSSASINDFAAAEGAVFYVKHNINFFSGRVIYSQGVQNITLPHEKTFDAGILYGIGFYRDLWFGNASIGVAYTATTKSVFDHIDSSFSHSSGLVEINRAELFRGIGLAWQAQLFSKFSDSSDVGMGITVCGNVNKSFPFWMLLFSLEFGNF